MTSPSSPLRARAEADRASLKQRYPASFRAPLQARLMTPATVVLATALAVYALWRFGFSPEKFIDGLGKLGIVIGLMIPPSPGNQLWNYIGALGETLSIAFLGTLGAAILALPVSMASDHSPAFWRS